MKIYIVNPGGNITAIVKQAVEPRERVKISKQILDNNPKVEQVGFWVAPVNKNSAGRIEMMGGEFCVNASRCLANLISKKKGIKKFYIECSGWDKQILAMVSKKKVILTMKNSKIILKDSKDSFMVAFPGITHFIVNKEYSKLDLDRRMKKIKKLNLPAAGVMYVTRTTGYNFKINPFVWVKATNTTYEETSCGSGSIAVALWAKKFFKFTKSKILQPSGSILSVNTTKKFVSISGEIKKSRSVDRV